MRHQPRTLALTAAGLLTLAALTACGGGAKTEAAPAAGGNAAAGAMADDDDQKIAQGTDLDKATAAGLGSDGSQVVSVTGDDTTCSPDTKEIKGGKVWFKFTNKGTKISELYLEEDNGEKLAEVERIKAGESGAFSFTVKDGKYKLSCVPGMNDKQLQVPLTVS